MIDNRGGMVRSYRIAKLADNQCWMVGNLKLGSTAGSIALTPDDTDITGNFTLPVLFGLGSSTTAYFTRVYGPVPGDTGTGIHSYGYLYNWLTATAGAGGISTMPAGSGTTPTSICAKGWRLPAAGTDAGDFYSLDIAFDGTAQYSYGGPLLSSWRSTSGPFKASHSGFFSGSFTDRTYSGQMWSGTASSTQGTNAIALMIGFQAQPPYNSDADCVYINTGVNRDWGRAIRCITR